MFSYFFSKKQLVSNTDKDVEFKLSKEKWHTYSPYLNKQKLFTSLNFSKNYISNLEAMEYYCNDKILEPILKEDLLQSKP